MNTSRRLKEWEEPHMLSLLRAWARHGCTITTIAEKMGIARETLYSWMRESPKITDAIRFGMAVTSAYVEDKLMSEIDKGNITAIIFYLKNRRKTVFNWPKATGIIPEVRKEDATILNEIMDVLDENPTKESEEKN